MHAYMHMYEHPIDLVPILTEIHFIISKSWFASKMPY